MQLQLLDPWLKWKESYEIVWPSFHPDDCLGVVLEFDFEVPLNFSIVLENLIKLCMSFFPQKLGK